MAESEAVLDEAVVDQEFACSSHGRVQVSCHVELVLDLLASVKQNLLIRINVVVDLPHPQAFRQTEVLVKELIFGKDGESHLLTFYFSLLY